MCHASSVYVDGCGGDVGGVVAEEESDDRSNLLRTCKPTNNRTVIIHVFKFRLSGNRVFAVFEVHFGHRPARRDRIHPNSVLNKLTSHVSRERANAGFGRIINPTLIFRIIRGIKTEFSQKDDKEYQEIIQPRRGDMFIEAYPPPPQLNPIGVICEGC